MIDDFIFTVLTNVVSYYIIKRIDKKDEIENGDAKKA